MRDIVREAKMYDVILRLEKTKSSFLPHQVRFVQSIVNRANNGELWSDRQLEQAETIIEQNEGFRSYRSEIEGSLGDIY